MKLSTNQGPASRSVARLQRCAFLFFAVIASGGTAFEIRARTIGLVSHNGFEPCWSKAVTANVFLQLLVSATDGREVCIPPAQDGSSCANSLCTDGSPGCNVTLRGGQYVAGTLQLADPGYARFDGSTGFDPFSMPVVVPIVGECTANFFDTTSVLITHQLICPLRPDGNSGYYVSAAFANNMLVTGLTSNKVSLSGGIGCQLANTGLNFYINVLSDRLGAAITEAVASETEGHSLCPLP